MSSTTFLWQLECLPLSKPRLVQGRYAAREQREQRAVLLVPDAAGVVERAGVLQSLPPL
jgi:hypothetical protein